MYVASALPPPVRLYDEGGTALPVWQWLAAVAAAAALLSVRTRLQLPHTTAVLLHTFSRPLPVLSNNFSGLRLLELLILLYISQLPSPHLNNIHLVTKHRSNPHRRSLASYSIPLCVYSYTRGKLPSSYLLQPFLSSLSSSHLAHLLFIAIRPVLSFKHHPLFILKPRNNR